MASKVETMAYANEVPWHGLGNSVSDDLTPAQMLKAAAIDWTVSKRKIFLDAGQEVKGQFALLRDSDDQFLSMVGETWKPVQNEIAMDFFKKYTEAGHMKMETAGSLANGKYVWALARLGMDFKLPGKGNDEVRGYLLLCSPHIRGKAMVIQFTPIRVVCWNTLNFALGSDLKGKAGAFRMPHSQEFNDSVKANAEIALGLAKGQMTEFKEMATLLAKKKAPTDKVEEFFCEVLKFNPKQGKRKPKADGEIREPRMLPKFRAALEHAPGQNIASAAGTWWGALNAVSYVIDHETGRDRSTALRNAWLGHTAGIKQRAVKLAIKNAA
jgi:phage/plasmid-like protein (TIGR03299 family)